MSIEPSAGRLSDMPPDLVADVILYETRDGGRAFPLLPGFRCPCFPSKEKTSGYTVFPLLGDAPMHPGERRRLGMVFLMPEAAAIMRGAGTFYLWDGSFFGEATVVSEARNISTLSDGE